MVEMPETYNFTLRDGHPTFVKRKGAQVLASVWPDQRSCVAWLPHEILITLGNVVLVTVPSPDVQYLHTCTHSSSKTSAPKTSVSLAPLLKEKK